MSSNISDEEIEGLFDKVADILKSRVQELKQERHLIDKEYAFINEIAKKEEWYKLKGRFGFTDKEIDILSDYGFGGDMYLEIHGYDRS